MIKRILAICFMVASIVLMAMPFGVRMNFGNPDGAPFVYYYSYFSGMPLGYANWFPIIAAVLAIVVTLLLIIKVSKRVTNDNSPGKAEIICICVCIIASVLSWVVFNAISVVGVIVLLLHAATFTLLILRKKHDVK